jgi:hypothetical protein
MREPRCRLPLPSEMSDWLPSVGASSLVCLFTLVEANTTSFGSYNTSGVLLCQHVEVHGHCSSNVVWSPISPSSPQIIPLSACHFTGQHYFPNEGALFWTDPNQKNIVEWRLDLCRTEVGKCATVWWGITPLICLDIRLVSFRSADEGVSEL